MALPEGLLEDIELTVLGGQALNGMHLGAVELRDERQTRAGRVTVDVYRAAAAHPVLASDVRAGQPEFVAQEVTQQQPGVDRGVDVLEPGVIAAADLEETAEAQGVEVRAGDSVLIHTGQGKYFEADREKYMRPLAGIGEESAHWLAEKNVFLAGADQLTFDAGFPFPGHRILLAENGIHIVENMNLTELAAALAERGTYEFVLVLNPLRLKGATASPLNAFAILP